MKKNNIYIVSICLAMLMLSACHSSQLSTETTENFSLEETKDLYLAVVVGSHSNFYQIPDYFETLEHELENVVKSNGKIAIIECDGEPYVYYESKLKPSEESHLSESRIEDDLRENIRNLRTWIEGCQAQTAEVNTLAAISLGAQKLSDKNIAERTLLILDSGLSTAGYLDFTKGFLESDPQEIVKQLKENYAIPNLEGVEVEWCYCGEVAYPQKKLSARQKNNLKTIWFDVLTAAGAKNVVFQEDTPSNMAFEGLPEVSTIVSEEETLSISTEPYVLDSKCVYFMGDKDQFTNEEEAKSILMQAAVELREHPDTKIYIVGTTARRDSAYCKELSEKRADAVKNVLLDYGVSSEQMITKGMGWDNHWYYEDIGTNGTQVESIAWKNRRALIIDINSEDAAYVEP